MNVTFSSFLVIFKFPLEYQDLWGKERHSSEGRQEVWAMAICRHQEGWGKDSSLRSEARKKFQADLNIQMQTHYWSKQAVSRRTQSWDEVTHRSHHRKTQPVSTQSCGSQSQGTLLHSRDSENIAEEGAKDLKSQMNRKLAVRRCLLETSEATTMTARVWG